MNKKLHKALRNEVPTIQLELKRINGGGCGVFAHEMQQALQAKGVPCHVVLVSGYSYNIDDVAKMIYNQGADDINTALMSMMRKGRGDTCCGHLCLEVDGELYDCRGRYKGHAISAGIKPEVMERLVYAPLWNPTFLEANSVPLGYVHGKLQSFFADVFKKVST